MDISLLVIGDELLSGETLDTNSQFAASLLNENGFSIKRKATTGDNPEEMKSSLKWLHQGSDLVISMGGIGPTRDDKTKETFTEYYQTSLEENKDVLESLKVWYSKRNTPLNELTAEQAMVPVDAEIFINPVGTAPVLWFKKGKAGKELICLPGVPFETKHLLKNIVLPLLLERNKGKIIINKTIQTIGIAESVLAGLFTEIENAIDNMSDGNFYKLAYLPSLGMVKLRLTAIGDDNAILSSKIQHWQSAIEKVASKYIFGYDNETISFAIGKLLIDQKATLSIAESCTGGYLSHLITATPGSSEYYLGTIIPYHYHLKTLELGINKETLETFGAVSGETAMEMVKGVLKRFNSTYAVATTGIAGPAGATSTKPVGTVWIAVGNKDNVIAKKFIFNYDRNLNIQLFSISALNLLRRFIIEAEPKE